MELATDADLHAILNPLKNCNMRNGQSVNKVELSGNASNKING
jgi:hypothetical protein